MDRRSGSAIEVQGLEKSYGTVRALQGIDIKVREGELFGFPGPNGAGKTTTIKILTGLARANAGVVRIAGIDATEMKKEQERRSPAGGGA